MSSFSAFKTGFKAALKVPKDTRKPRSRRQVLTFNEALEDLKTSQTGFVICAAFRSFGRCRKEIPLLDSKFLANLDHMDFSDVQAPIKLMPLMLCSTHWGKTIYHNALFLDWLSVYGSKQDYPQFENIVVDYQSAIMIHTRESSSPDMAISPRSISEGQERPISTPNTINRDQNYLETVDKVGQVQMNSDHEARSLPEIELDYAAPNLPEISVLVGMESYASIELGVASLEILYQETLRCVAMTSDGWRCPTLIPREEQLRAQELLSSHATAGKEIDIELSRLVLCPGHAVGELPRLYAEKWAEFSKQRLSKTEAMSKFNAEFWMSVQFFSSFEKRDDNTFRGISSNRPRSASHTSSRSRDAYDFGSIKDSGRSSCTTEGLSPWGSATQNFKYTFSARPHSSETGFEQPSSSDPSSHFEGIERQPQLVPGLGSIFAQAVAKSPHLNTIGSSTSQNVSKEAISLEHNTKAQDAQAKIPTEQPSSHGTFQKTRRVVSQDEIDKALIEEMRGTPSKGGFVHIFESPSKKLCKIGRAISSFTRAQQAQAECQLQDLDHIPVTSAFTMFPSQVTKLVHLELQNFRIQLNCENQHHPRCDGRLVQSEHQEWFDVTSTVAMQSVFLWCKVANLAYTTDGKVKPGWAEKLTLLPKPSSVETSLLQAINDGGTVLDIESYHHERRKRYEGWLNGKSA
ncbi:hypothetical protein VTL71DRAFT_10400 [Oculimacula yallundae]|uniref:Bacteriophage T5 Orf172 DNA-binding domain-containing protein n=1 Tax=Oculimacula yallundae TaxID=86028 RepID=A0ABR4CSZ5_9HELO